MKKIITILALVAAVGLGLGANTAMAHGWGYGHHGYMNGSGYGMMNGNGYGMMNGYYGNADNGAYQKFLDQTKDLRASLAADRAELSAELASPKPDHNRVRALAGSISAKRDQLASIARTNDVAPMGPGFGRGIRCAW